MTGKVRIILAFCTSILLLILIGFYAYRSTKKYRESYSWVSHTQLVISEAQKLQLALQEMETAERGYIITGNPRYLNPYKVSSIGIEGTFNRLRKLIADDAAQKEILDSVGTVMHDQITLINAGIAIRKDEGFKAAQKLILTNRGENLMAGFRTGIAGFISNENAVLEQRILNAQKDYQRTIVIIVSSIVLALIIVAMALYLFIKDYNRRVRSKRRLLESENRIKKFLEALPLGIFVLDHEGKAYYANSKATLLVGEPTGNERMEDLDIKDLPDAYRTVKAGTDDVYPPMEMPVIRALMGEKDICVEDLEVCGNGKRIPLRINATNITNEAGKIEYAIAVFEDITDARIASQKLKEAIELARQAVELKEAFLANMSHEIRTPMNAIIGFTNLLLNNGDLKPKEKDYVHTIRTSGENLLRIINDILDVSKIESGMMSFELHSISIREVFSSLNSMLRPKVLEKKLALDLDCAPDVPETVLGDPTRLTQILLNLLGNAIKFTSRGGVDVYAEVASEDDETCEIIFSVKDTGIGIPADKVLHIFERFTQAESHTTRQYGGTGLGLSIAKQLVELQGGKINVSSKTGSGSCFTFTIPFRKSTGYQSVKSEKPDESKIRALAQKQILLVEDNPINVKFIQSLFSGYDIPVELAENGQVAVSMLETKTYDIVLMDIEMPVMNGYEATGLIRNRLKIKTPVIAMTANAMAGESEKCLSAGMNAYISKPIREDYLFEQMVSLIAENEHRPDEKGTEKQVDLTYLSRSLKENNTLILETIDVFFTQVNEDLYELNEAFERLDHAAIKRFAHRMKSTVSIVGAKKMENVLIELEQLAQQKMPMEQLNVFKNQLKSMTEQTVEEVRSGRLNYVS